MTPIGPMRFRRGPEDVRRQVDVAAAAAWEALVEAHTGHALRFIALMATRMDFDEALTRYLDELDVRDPMASAVRSRVLVALDHALQEEDDRPSLHAYDDDDRGAESRSDRSGLNPAALRRFRPDVLMKGIARKVRDTGMVDEWIRLAVARAEEGVIRAHIENAIMFVSVLRGHEDLDEAVDDYLELMRVSGGRAQSVHQRTMARLAEMHLPEDEGEAWESDEADDD